jgi:hypothetical protein
VQGENETYRDFLVRTDSLALRLGINVQDLPPIIGIGRASLFSYRSGNRPITRKAWLKLAAAENSTSAARASPGLESSVVREDPVEYGAKKGNLEQDPSVIGMLEKLDARLKVLELPVKFEDLMARMAAANAWPPQIQDRKLTLSELLEKYPPTE